MVKLDIASFFHTSPTMLSAGEEFARCSKEHRLILLTHNNLSDVKYGNIDDRTMQESKEWDWDHTLVLKPDQLMEYKVGTCWDQSLYTYSKLIEVLGRENVRVPAWWLITPKGECESHTTILAKVDTMYFWDENAWEEWEGIHYWFSTWTGAEKYMKSHIPKHKKIDYKSDVSAAYDKLLAQKGNITVRQFVEAVFGITV